MSLNLSCIKNKTINQLKDYKAMLILIIVFIIAVHQIRASDIKVIAAMGDTFTVSLCPNFTKELSLELIICKKNYWPKQIFQ